MSAKKLHATQKRDLVKTQSVMLVGRGKAVMNLALMVITDKSA